MNSKEEIRKILINKPHLKDSDPRLMATFWYQELKRKNLKVSEITALDFLNLFAKSKLTNPETIRRMRAKLQEECPELRGEVYNMRKGKKQDQWRNDLGYEV